MNKKKRLTTECFFKKSWLKEISIEHDVLNAPYEKMSNIQHSCKVNEIRISYEVNKLPDELSLCDLLICISEEIRFLTDK